MSTMTTPAATEQSKASAAADAGPEPKQLDALHTAYGDKRSPTTLSRRSPASQPVRFPASTPWVPPSGGHTPA